MLTRILNVFIQENILKVLQFYCHCHNFTNFNKNSNIFIQQVIRNRTPAAADLGRPVSFEHLKSTAQIQNIIRLQSTLLQCQRTVFIKLIHFIVRNWIFIIHLTHQCLMLGTPGRVERAEPLPLQLNLVVIILKIIEFIQKIEDSS